MHAEVAVLLLFAAATAVAIASRRLKVPYTVALVACGLALGSFHVVDGVHLTRHVLYAVFLPGLIFEAAYHLGFSELRESARGIVLLAVPGVALAIAVTATLLVAGAPLAGIDGASVWPLALVFAALIAATDPIAVVALFKSLGAPRRLGVVIEAESLVNDGTGVVLFTIVCAGVSGGVPSVGRGLLEFATVVGMAVGVGAAVGLAASVSIGRLDAPMIAIALTTLAAYGSFVLSEALGFSGIIATVTVGLVCGNVAGPRSTPPATRIAVESFWEFVAFALNSLVFLLIGLEAPVARLVSAWRPILVAYAAVTVGRAVVVFLASALLRPTRERLPWSWSAMLVWGGLRGALSIVLALALPGDFARRELVVTMTFGVVLVSTVVQGLTAAPLLRALRLTTEQPSRPASGSVAGRA